MECVIGGTNAQPLFDRRVKIADRDAAHGDRSFACLNDDILYESIEINDFSAYELPGYTLRPVRRESRLGLRRTPLVAFPAQELRHHAACDGAAHNDDCAVRHESRGYSTVTDLARLRGWSTSVPFITAT